MSIITFACRHLGEWDRAHTAKRSRGIFLRSLKGMQPPYQLHVGCGSVRMEGWINADLSDPHFPLDLSRPIPLPDGSCSLVFHEHVMEHLPLEIVPGFLTECRRILRPGGRMRIAMPDLEESVAQYLAEDWRGADWLLRGDFEVRTRCEMINAAFRWWGHQWLYDREELELYLREAGFTTVEAARWGESREPRLSSLETRRESNLICEVER